MRSVDEQQADATDDAAAPLKLDLGLRCLSSSWTIERQIHIIQILTESTLSNEVEDDSTAVLCLCLCSAMAPLDKKENRGAIFWAIDHQSQNVVHMLI